MLAQYQAQRDTEMALGLARDANISWHGRAAAHSPRDKVCEEALAMRKWLGRRARLPKWSNIGFPTSTRKRNIKSKSNSSTNKQSINSKSKSNSSRNKQRISLLL
ncbi:hypothetical protein HAX54_002005 [Datura stramonium]|uniref:Uncharacterized protein n=1 Tax=Datura stramonium TaxID=4076 RepID=A0ABS8WUW4_DATST|nr:hypothetical protein [Datura stramonium]